MSTERVRTCTPPSQAAVQVPQLPHALGAQSRLVTALSQYPSRVEVCVQGVASWSAPQAVALPVALPFACVATVRCLISKPSPHVAMQLVVGSHADSVQFLTQAATAQRSPSFSAGHALPACAAAVTTVRVRFLQPPPHVTAQAPQLPHAETEQGTGQRCVLHGVLSASAGHACPPLAAGVVTCRTRCFMVVTPSPPSTALHCAPHAPHDDHAVTTQATTTFGHDPWLHDCVSARLEEHAAPPFAAAVSTLRCRDCVPPPHVAEHAPHAPQAATTQSRGQPPVLHACVCGAGQGVPPKAGGVAIVAVRCCVPPLHVAEQAPHAAQPDATQSTLAFDNFM